MFVDSKENIFVRTRFAPAPSGTIHLGNIRAALINLIFAKQHQGKFVLRIEDTDKEKVTEKHINNLLKDLNWLGIFYDEGPEKPGDYAPYFQSKRQEHYYKGLKKIISLNRAYKCFCSKERLEKMREEQVAAKIAPHYDRLCYNLSQSTIEEKLTQQTPFVWRYLINHDEKIELNDLVRGKIFFDMKNFSDFIICRQDHSFNFIFANFIDDVDMQTSHIIRGEDHLSNGALQASLYQLFKLKTPSFIHLPLILDENGQKLSKSDKNFDLHSLKEDGFLPEAICNYLACIGSNLDNKPLNLTEMISSYDFSSLSSQSVRYEMKKIRSLNKKWIEQLSAEELLKKMEEQLTFTKLIGDQNLLYKAIDLGKKSAETLKEVYLNIKSLLTEPKNLTDEIKAELQEKVSPEMKIVLKNIIKQNSLLSFELLESIAKEHNLSKQSLFIFIRVACTGLTHGFSIRELLEFFSNNQILKYCEKLLEKIS